MTTFSRVLVTESVSTSAARYKLLYDGQVIPGDTALSYNIDGTPVTVSQGFDRVTLTNLGTTPLYYSRERSATFPTIAAGGDGVLEVGASGGFIVDTGPIARLQFIRASGTGNVEILLETL